MAPTLNHKYLISHSFISVEEDTTLNLCILFHHHRNDGRTTKSTSNILKIHWQPLTPPLPLCLPLSLVKSTSNLSWNPSAAPLPPSDTHWFTIVEEPHIQKRWVFKFPRYTTTINSWRSNTIITKNQKKYENGYDELHAPILNP